MSTLVVAAAGSSVLGCGGEDLQNVAPAQAAPTTGTPAPSIDAGAAPEAGSALSELCNGLDDDGDGDVDEGCPCSVGATQSCYPAGAPPGTGCRQGEQICNAGAWGPCAGATLPADGEVMCCGALGATPEFKVLDAYLATYPAAAMPMTHDDVIAFVPKTAEYSMKWTWSNAGSEFVDYKAGGVSDANLEKGRAFARQQAIESLPADATVVATLEKTPMKLTLGGSNGCDGVGWAWGSILVESADFSVSEVAYLYVGFCAFGSVDSESAFFSDMPVEVCEPPQLPR